MTETQPRHSTVAVAVIYNSQLGFLLWNNKRWGGYAFPMKHMHDGDDPPQTALQTVSARDFPLDLSDASASALEETGWFGRSEGAKEVTYYDYHVVEVIPGSTLNPTDLDPDLRFFTHSELQAAANVTEPTRAIATTLVENQEVVAAVFSREKRSELEFLLVCKSDRGYFFPSLRRKTHEPLEILARQAVVNDLAYNGDVQTSYCSEVSHQRPGTRYGASNRHYRFYLVGVWLTGGDQFEPGNPLATALDDLQAIHAAAGRSLGPRGYVGWFTAEEIKTRNDVSPDAKAILLNAVKCATKCRR